MNNQKMTVHPIKVEPGYMVGNCMAPTWNNGDRCWLAWYDISWESIAALHGKVCVYDYRGNRTLRAHGGILDRVEITAPHDEQVLVFRTLNPKEHATIRRVPLRLLTTIGQIYAWDEHDLIPEPAESYEPPSIEVQVIEPQRQRAKAIPTYLVSKKASLFDLRRKPQ
jgi:hypothetical protein